MNVSQITHEGRIVLQKEWRPENIIEIERKNFSHIIESICNGQCRYPLLAIRILVQAIVNIESNGKTYLSARQLAKILDAQYTTVNKCLVYLRKIDVLQIDR